MQDFAQEKIHVVQSNVRSSHGTLNTISALCRLEIWLRAQRAGSEQNYALDIEQNEPDTTGCVSTFNWEALFVLSKSIMTAATTKVRSPKPSHIYRRR
jgi:hypothetical protein